ncbi:MAG TPA: tetratricopeptide repeat protein, partial [Phenylobacterium sp.]|nr:tetratricopeptide repeat protein [Phenylobacterium sp.]
MSPRTLIPATAVAALATALASQAQAQPIVRLPDQAPVTLGDLPIRTAPPEAADPRAAPQVVSPVEALVRQAQTWRRQGRNDQAEATLKRALALSPDAPEVLYQLADLSRAKGDAMGAAIWTGKLAAARPGDPRLAALAKAVPAPVAQAGTLSPFQAAPAPRIEVQAAAPLPAPQGQALPAAVKPTAKAAPAPAGGQLRADGFQALNSGDLGSAERLFGQALKASAQDREAAGGLGVMRLRQQRFAEARDLLARAVQGPNAAGWREAYEAADFFANLRVAADAREAGRLAEAETKARKLAARNLPYAVE